MVGESCLDQQRQRGQGQLGSAGGGWEPMEVGEKMPDHTSWVMF